jgi:putative transposase
MTMITIRGLFHQSPHERIIAMSTRNVLKSNRQVKLFLDPALLHTGFEIETLLNELPIEMNAIAVSADPILLQQLLEAEVAHMVGKRYSRDGELYIWGKQRGYFYVGGQKVGIERPRVRTGGKQSKEVVPSTYTKFQDRSERAIRVFREVLASVSCRKYPEAIEKMRAGYGVSKSVVSRELVTATAAQLDALCNRSLEDFDLAVLMIDGIDLAGTMFIAALGVDQEGKKRILGFHDGATENSTVCIRMLEDLCERGLRLDHPFLAVLDGSKALGKAMRAMGGKHVVIQRCQVHKIRNVLSHLPNTYHVHFDRKIRVAYGMTKYAEARKALEAVVRELQNISVSAARSLEEGLEETLTMHRLCLPESLRKSFSSTNIIESAYARARHLMRNVKRWRSTMQKSRWIATALLHTEKSFRRIKGHYDMPVLKAALAEDRIEKSQINVAA